MPEASVVFYCEKGGGAPALRWLDDQPPKVQDRFIVRIERLAECGSELRRPEADYLRDGIYELRVRHMNVNYRMLYFFSGAYAVVAHGLKKKDKVPGSDIARAIARRDAYVGDPEAHTFKD